MSVFNISSPPIHERGKGVRDGDGSAASTGRAVEPYRSPRPPEHPVVLGTVDLALTAVRAVVVNRHEVGAELVPVVSASKPTAAHPPEQLSRTAHR